MAQFTELGTRQLYIVNKVALPAGIAGEGKFKGDAAKTQAWLSYESTGGQVRSTIIDKNKVRAVVAKDASAQVIKGKATEVVLDAPLIAGQDYILGIDILNFISPSPSHKYYKYGVVRAHADMEEAKFYAMMAVSLFDNFKREAAPMLKFGLAVAAGGSGETQTKASTTWITAENKKDMKALIALGATSLVIDTVAQDWILGAMKSTSVDYVVMPSKITQQGVEVNWGTATNIPSTLEEGNGKVIADMEYFYKGNRGDQYRNVGFPYIIPYKAIANPEAMYSTIDIVFYKQGTGVESEMSENTITIACPKLATGSAKNAVANAVIADLKSLLGVTIADLPNA